MRMSEFARAIKFINSHRWREATTMKDIPHSYVVRANIPDKDEFNWFDDFIHREGEVGYFGKRMFKYLYLNGYKYFDCGDQRTVTDLVNRDQYPKSFRDSQTPYIPDIFGMQQQDEEDEEIAEYLSAIPKFRNIYNPECGAGRMYDILCRVNPDSGERYCGSDCSLSKLTNFRDSKHPYRLYFDKANHLYLGQADLVVTLEAENLNAYGLRRIRHMAGGNGQVLLFSKKELNLPALDKYHIAGEWENIKLHNWNLLKPKK